MAASRQHRRFIIFVVMTIEPDVTNPSRERLVTFSSMAISTDLSVPLHPGEK